MLGTLRRVHHRPLGGLMSYPLQPERWRELAEHRAEWLAERGLPEDWEPDPEDLEPWWLMQDL